jgi:hypothetical protein
MVKVKQEPMSAAALLTAPPEVGVQLEVHSDGSSDILDMWEPETEVICISSDDDE